MVAGGSILYLPTTFAIDRQPENRLEIQHLACGESGIMIYLKLAKRGADDVGLEDEDGAGVPHCSQVFL